MLTMAPWLGIAMLTLATKARGQDGPPGSLLRCCGSPLTHHTYCLPGAWTDESTFVVTVLDASGSEVALRKTNPNPNPNYIPSPTPNPNPNPSPNP